MSKSKNRVHNVSDYHPNASDDDALSEVIKVDNSEHKISDKPKTVHRAIANRNFDQMKRGESVVINPNDQYWVEQVAAGNIIVTSEAK